jgi:hypothetical protein
MRGNKNYKTEQKAQDHGKHNTTNGVYSTATQSDENRKQKITALHWNVF